MTAIFSPTESAGIGFAIPSNDAVFRATYRPHDVTVRPGYLGVKIGPVTQHIAAALGMKVPMGSIISEIDAGGPAAAAGMRVGDVILRYDNGTPPDERASMRAVVRSPVGQPVTDQPHLPRGRARPDVATHAGGLAGQERRITLLVRPPRRPCRCRTLSRPRSRRRSPKVRALQYGLRTDQNGVVVAGVVAGTDAFDHFVRPGDVILRVQDTDVETPQAVQHVVDVARAQHKPLVLALVLPKASQFPGPHWYGAASGRGGDTTVAVRRRPKTTASDRPSR